MIDFTDNDVLAQIKSNGFLSADESKAAIAEANKNLEANKNSILEQHKELRKSVDGIDISAIRGLMEDQRFSKIMENGFDSYEAGLGGEHQAQLHAAQSDLMISRQDVEQLTNKLAEQENEYKNKLMQSEVKRMLGRTISENQDSIHPTAVAEIERQALGELTIDQKGELIVLDAEGTAPRMTADGPMRAGDWIKEDMKNNPHRYKGPSGTNYQHPQSGTVVGDNLFGRARRDAARNANR